MVGRLFEAGARAASRAARAVVDSAPGREVAATAVGLAQRGKKRLGEARERLLHAVGLAAREDYAEVARRMARLKRKVRELSRRVEGSGRDGPGSEARRGAARSGEEPEYQEPEDEEPEGGAGGEPR